MNAVIYLIVTILRDRRDGKKKSGWIKRAALCLVQASVYHSSD